MTTTISNFPCTASQTISSGCTITEGSKTITLEPSGLVVVSNKLYMVSDNGYLVSMDVSSGDLSTKSWTKVHNFSNDPGLSGDRANYDLESITLAGGKLMIGVEGDSTHSPNIFRFDTSTNAATGSAWNLTDVTLTGGGMEAMTFVPIGTDLYGGTRFYNGYFFASYQSLIGSVYVYDLPQSTNVTTDVTSAVRVFDLTDGTKKMTLPASDMCFANGYLFVLFDKRGTTNEIHVYSIRSDGTGLNHKGAYYVPTVAGLQTDFEGITIDGSNMYLCIDQKSGTKAVVRFTDYSIDKFV